MSDDGSKYTERQMRKLKKQLEEVYSQAEKDITAKMNDFNERYKVKYKINRQKVQDGKMTQERFDQWVKGQVFQGQQWMAKREQIARTLADANRIAVGMVNNSREKTFIFNSNYEAYQLEHGAGINFGFDLYDAKTVENLIRNEPTLLPPKKLDLSKDIPWNMKSISRQVTLGIVEGESLQDIAKRIAEVTGSMNMKSMMRTARTAMTGAQNAGRNLRLQDAKAMGINVMKEWMATLDGRTRDSHRDMDGEKISVGDKWHHYKFSNGCEYPGDPAGPPREVYNCRCTMVGDIVDYPSEYERYDNIDGKPIKNMTYREWEKAKKQGPIPQTMVNLFQSKLGLCKTVQEVNDLMNSQGWFKNYNNGDPFVVDLIGCDLDSAKSIAASYDQVFEKFPQLKGKIHGVDAHPIGMRSNTYAWCYTNSGGKVQVNPSLYNNWSKLSKDYERDVLTNWHPYGTTAESIVTHEIGHAIDGFLTQEGMKNGSLSKQISALWRPEVAKACGIKVADIEKEVSRYASKNAKEWWAECFAEYITSANPRPVAAEFGRRLEEYLRRINL